MNNRKIIKMCMLLARKYSDPQEFDDLVSEGLIKCLELKNSGVTNPKILYKSAAIQMNEYYNIRKHTVFVPVQGKAKGLSVENDSINWTDVAMFNALRAEVIELNENVATTPSVEIEYEQKEWIRHIKSIMVEVLDKEEMKIIDMRYFSNMTQDEVGNELGHNKMWVSRKEKAALSRVRNNL